jgi:8-oxo-dGTP pyrophosphatase MutT (NUDIX family)
MCIALKHLAEMSDYFPSQVHLVFEDLLDAEKALRKITGCVRVNFVKFANAAEHLHWHFIPRYKEEKHLKLNSWEIQERHFQATDLYTLAADSKLHSQGLLLPSQNLFNAIFDEIQALQLKRAQGVFGACMVLRAQDPAQREHWASQKLCDLMKAARAQPQNFESLLMLQNYGHRHWDHLGGNGDSLEFPEQIARRELREEVGWQVSELLEVCRQWSQGLIKGFVYLVQPESSISWHRDVPERVLCPEVAALQFFNLQQLALGEFESEGVPKKVQQRHLAFLNAVPDFHEVALFKRLT